MVRIIAVCAKFKLSDKKHMSHVIIMITFQSLHIAEKKVEEEESKELENGQARSGQLD